MFLQRQETLFPDPQHFNFIPLLYVENKCFASITKMHLFVIPCQDQLATCINNSVFNNRKDESAARV